MIGAKGKVTICVDDSQQFTKRFDLQLSSLSIETSQRLHETDRVFQFTDSVQIRDMTCVNVGGMVSPIQGSNVCFRKRSEWVGLNHIVPDMEGMGWFAERLAPEEIGVIQGDLSFSIQPPNIRELEHDMEPYRIKEKLYLACTQNGGFGFHRPYSNFHTNGTWLEFRFPVESLEKIQGLSTICPGDGTHVKLSVTNNSLRDLGAKTKDGRKLVVQFYRNTNKDVAHSHIDLIVDGKKCDLKLANRGNLWRGTQFEIPCLGAGQTKTFAGTLKLSSQVSPYSRLAIQAEILLEELKGVNVESPKMIPIQRRQLKVSSEPIYTPSPYNQVVLVTCATTTKEQFNAWSELLINRLGLSVEYFSVSICGSLDPSFTPPNVMGEGTKSITLAQAFAEKLVIVLDSVFNPLDESVSRTEPSRMLPNGSQSQTSGYNKSTRWLLVGSSDDAVKQALASHFTAPPDDVTNYTDFSSFKKAMKEELKRERDEGCVTDERICEYSIRVNNGKENNRFNKGKSIGKKAKECVKHLKKNDPLRQYVVEPRMTIKDDAETAYRLLVVRRGYCRTANTTYVLKEAVSPKEADGNALLAIVKSLPLDTLQLVFAKAVSDEDEVLLDVAMDVYTQHLIWGVSSVLDGQLECNNVEEEDLSKIFPTLASVTLCSKMHTVATSHGDRGKRALSQLLARLECVARSKDLNPGPFPFSLRNRTRKVLLKMVATLKEEWADIIFDDARLEEIHALEKKVKDHLKSTYGGPFPRQRSASRWRKGKIGHCCLPVILSLDTMPATYILSFIWCSSSMFTRSIVSHILPE